LIFFSSLIGNVDDKSIKKRYEEANRKFGSAKDNELKKEIATNKVYSKGMKFLYNTLTSIKSGNNSESKLYFQALEKTMGDYDKRESKITKHVEKIVSSTHKYLTDKKYNNEFFKYSLIGIYHESHDILTAAKYKAMFKKACEIAQKKGDSNTSVTIFKLAYFALAFFTEMSTIHLMDFELDVINGMGPERAMENLHNTYRAFMKNVAMNIIPVNEFFKTMTGNPSSIITKLSSEEDKLAKAMSKESLDYSSDAKMSVEAEDDFKQFLAGGLITTTGIVGVLTVPVMGVSLFVVVIGLVVLTIPLIRYIIYWISTMKIDMGKSLELKAEMLDNNIASLRERLEQETDPKEKARLESVMKKQQQYVDKWQTKAEKLLKDENEASYVVMETIQKEDNAPEPTTSGNDELIL